MSLATVEKFYALVQDVEALQVQLASAESQEAFNQLAVQLGEANGYSFASEDVDAFIEQKLSAENVELADEDLEAISGGKQKCLGKFTTVCFISKRCWGSQC